MATTIVATLHPCQCWIVDPDLDRIEVLALSEDGNYELRDTFASPEILEVREYPGLKLPLEDVFA